MSEPHLFINGLTAGYVADLPILKDVSVSANKGRLTVIIGPNGAGKSTLIKAVIGQLAVTEGSIILEGRDATGWAPDRMIGEGIAYVPQTDNIFRTLTIQQNLDLALRNVAGKAERLAFLFERFPALAEKRGSKAGSLSGGQRQFLAVAMALATEPGVMLMDEPSAGLSPKGAEEVLDYVQTLTRDGVTVLLVEQNVKQALKRADYCYVLAEGRNQIDGPAAPMLEDPALRRIYLGGERRGAA